MRYFLVRHVELAEIDNRINFLQRVEVFKDI